MKYIKDIQKTLQEDFVESKVVPFVGAGFSKNAALPQGISIPDWNELGHQCIRQSVLFYIWGYLYEEKSYCG